LGYLLIVIPVDFFVGCTDMHVRFVFGPDHIIKMAIWAKKVKARRHQLRAFEKELRKQVGSSQAILFLLRLLTVCKVGGLFFCCWSSFVVVGAATISAYAGSAGGARRIAVMNVVLPQIAKITGRPRGDTAKPPKAKRPTVKPRTAVGID